MKRKLCVLLAILFATGSLTSLSACEIGELDFLNSLIESSSSDSSSSDSSSSDSSSSDSSSSDGSSSDSSSSDSSSSDSSSSDSSSEQGGGDTNNPNVIDGVDFSIPAIDKQYGYTMLADEPNGTFMQSLYKDIYEACVAFSKSEVNVSPTDGKYRFDEVSVSEYYMPVEEAVAVWAVVRQDYPEFWWLNNSLSFTNDGSVMSEMYVEISADYALGSVRKSIDAQLKTLALDCAQYIDETDSELVRALTIYEYLSANFTYAYDENGSPSMEAWAHNLVGGAMSKSGVCETYAKTYEWFCELFGLECAVVNGYGITSSGAEHHAWNAVRVDGLWYGVDATWSYVKDQKDNLYVTRKYFGMGATEFIDSHLAIYPQNYGINYQVPAPTLTENYLCPVYYGKKGESKVFVGSIDYAFSQMIDENASYEIELYPETEIMRTASRKLYPNGATFITKTLPKVAHIEFIGRYVYINASQYWNSTLTLQKNATVTLQSDITVRNLTVENENTLVKNGYQYTKKSTK